MRATLEGRQQHMTLAKLFSVQCVHDEQGRACATRQEAEERRRREAEEEAADPLAAALAADLEAADPAAAGLAAAGL